MTISADYKKMCDDKRSHLKPAEFTSIETRTLHVLTNQK